MIEPEYIGQKKIYMKNESGKRKMLGVVTKDGRFISFRKEKHKFRMYDGWGINVRLINTLQVMNIRMIEIRTEKRLLRIPLETALKVGIKYKNPKGSRDMQLIIPEKAFSIYKLPTKEAIDYEEVM